MLKFDSQIGRLRKRIIVSICLTEKISYRLKKSFCKRLLPEFISGVDYERDLSGYIYKGNTSDHIDRSIFLCGIYEKFLLQAIHDFSINYGLTGQTFLDVGANVGNHSLFFSSFAGEVHSFEPYAIAYKKLENNITSNNIRNIYLHNIALGQEDKSAALYAPENGNLGTASLNSDFKGKTERAGDVEIRNADAYIASQRIENIKLIKIDVEGHEKPVLLGLEQTMLKNRPIIVFEMSPETFISFANKAEFLKTFPQQYCFYKFASANKSSGNYKLTKYVYGDALRYEDIIAVPSELRNK